MNINTMHRVILFISLGISCCFYGIHGENSDSAAINPGQPNLAVWHLERLSVERIKACAEQCQQQLQRSDLYKKALFFAGGALATGGLVWLGAKLLSTPKASEPEVDPVTIPPGPEISEQEYRRAMLALKREMVDDNKASLSFWGSIRQGVNDGAAVAFYSFVGSLVLAALSSTWKKTGHGIVRSIGLESVKDSVKEYAQMVSVVGRSVGELIPEYEQACEQALVLNDQNAITTSFMTFLEREIVKQHAMFIQVIEEAIAFLSEVQQRNAKDSNKELLQAFDDQMNIFWGVLDSYADALENMLNAPLDKNKPIVCKKVLLISKQIYYQADHFIEECKSLALQK